MAQKEIYLQTQGLKSSSISVSKSVGWVSINFDDLKINVDAYNGFPCFNQPRESSLITIATEKTVYELSPEQLQTIIQFFCAYHVNASSVVHYPNRNHAILPDRYKKSLRQSKKGLDY